MLRITLSITALLGLASAALGQGFDVIVLHEGAPKRGNVVEESKDAITLDISGVKVPVEVGKIKRVTFADAPALLTAGQSSLADGQLEDAIEKLSKIDKADIQRDIVGREVDYYLALAKAKLALAGGDEDPAAATGAMLKIAQNTGSYHYYEANEVTGDLALALNPPRPDKAAEFYANVGAAPWPEYKVKAALLGGEAMLAGENYKGAYDKFQMVIGANLNTPLALELKDYAALGKAKCLAEAGKPVDGVKEAEKIIADRDSRDGELFGRAYNALGYCHEKAGDKKLALLDYLRVHLLFYQDPAQHAEALYHLRTLWKSVNDAGRSLEAANLLKQRYPNSVWNTKATTG